MVDERARILGNEEVRADFFKIRLKALAIAREAKAGQFVMVRCSEDTDPLLRRPFSFHKISKSGFELLYEVVGTGTKVLSKRKKGEMISVIGPLGNGFNLNPKTKPHNSVLLIAGGMGVAPLLELAQRITNHESRITVLIGAKTKKQILCEEEFKKLGCQVLVTTEDGSKGCMGLVTDLLKKKMGTSPSGDMVPCGDSPHFFLYACGPRAMLQEIAKIAKTKKIHCQMSLEEKMACGTGACLGCAVKTKNGYKMVCKDGPVFNAEEIIW